MKKVGISVKSIILNTFGDDIGNRFYNGISPQREVYPLAIGRVEGIVPIDVKWANNEKPVSCNDTFIYAIYVYSFDQEECADIAWKMRQYLDFYRGRPTPEGAKFNEMRFEGGSEDLVDSDSRDLFCWKLSFTIRVDDGWQEI